MALPQGWASTSFETLLDYEQPQAYIVESTEYKDDYATPVLTAGKSFVIGHTNETSGIYNDRLPVIIFDDFTTATQFVTFPFKVKSSAMKMLQTVSPELNIKYLFYRMQVIRHNTTTHKRYWISDYSKSVIELPPIAEQHRIVTKIDALFSELDKGVELLQTIRQKLRIYRQAVLKWAFEGKLTNATLTEAKLGDYIEKPRYGTSKKCSAEKGSTCVLRIPNIKFSAGTIDYGDVKFADFDDAELSALRLCKGDILIIRSNGSVSLVGRAAIVRKCDEANLFAGYLIRLRINNAALSSDFLLHYLSSLQARLYIEATAKSTSGVNNINSNEIGALPIPICARDEQENIVAEIDSRLSVCDKLEQLIDDSLSKAQALRQSILKRAFAGQFVPQDPNDEPAEKLLERIKALKAAEIAKAKPTRRKKNA